MVVNWNSGDDGPEDWPGDGAVEALVGTAASNGDGDAESTGDAAMTLGLVW